MKTWHDKLPTEAEAVEQLLDTAAQSLQRAMDLSYRTPMVSIEMRHKLKKAYDSIEVERVTLKVKINKITDKISYDTYVAGIYAQLKEKKRRKHAKV
jgi:hypothetical protein